MVRAGSGYIDYDEFFAAMVRLNFVGVQRELEGLFDRYDENCDGTLDYKVRTAQGRLFDEPHAPGRSEGVCP